MISAPNIKRTDKEYAMWIYLGGKGVTFYFLFNRSKEICIALISWEIFKCVELRDFHLRS